MDIIVWIIFGAIAGWIASIIMKKNKKMGAIANIVVGIIGAFLGGYIMELVGVEVDRFKLKTDVVLDRKDGKGSNLATFQHYFAWSRTCHALIGLLYSCRKIKVTCR